MKNRPSKHSILAVLLLGIVAVVAGSPGAFGQKNLEIQTLKDRVYRLENGPVNRCPEKLGFQLNSQATELLLFPMEIEWEKIRTHVSPVVVVRGLRRRGESPYEEIVHAGRARSSYAAVLESNTIEAVTRTRLIGSILIESHAKLEFLRDRLHLTRWSISDDLPLMEDVLCAYREAHVIKTAQNLAQ